jgi:hypothetical protein
MSNVSIIKTPRAGVTPLSMPKTKSVTYEKSTTINTAVS